MPNAELATRLFLQIAVILATCQLVGRLVARIGQPRVIGEMLAGIILGPSLFGLFFPNDATALFPPANMSALYLISQIGLTLYMFLVGVEFEVDVVRPRLRTALAVSLAGIFAPFALGALVALIITTGPQFVPEGISAWHSALFLGACMSITAFPVLARILQERGLTGTPLGNLVLAAGAIDDVAAWSILAIVLASLNESPTGALVTVGGTGLYAAVMLFAGRPLFQRLWGQRPGPPDPPRLTPATLTSILVVLMVGAWYTEGIGIHAIFGAFVFGLALPRGLLTSELKRNLEPLVAALLLPLFFAYSGLNTRIGLLDSLALWVVAAGVLAAASFGKVAGCTLGARLSGEGQQTSLAIGALMNARGLMELIILNVGLQRGLITPTLFTIMVIMAIATTVLASPLFTLVYGSEAERARTAVFS